MKEAFIRFLNLKNALDLDPAELDSTSIKLLEICELKRHAGLRLRVTDAMKIASVGSPLTIHRRLVNLIEHGYLTVEFENGDRRTKYLVPTSKSHDYFSKLGELIVKSAI